MARAAKKSEYDVHPGVAMVQEWVAGLKEKTGRSLAEWMSHIRKEGPREEKALRAWLKEKHELGTNSAWWLAERAIGEGGDDDPEGYLKAAPRWVEAQYSGKRAGLREIYDGLVALVRRGLPEARICPCETIVPVYRSHVIAQIKPTTISRVDLGLALGKHKGKLPARLVHTGGLAKKDRITHRIELTKVDEIDDGVKKWLLAAWELDG